MNVTEVFAGLPVTDYDVALDWYERLLGRGPDMLPTAGEAAWQVTGPAWVYLVEDAERAGRGLLTLLVKDLPARIEELAARGLTAGPVYEAPGVVRRTIVTDPDGNRIQLGEPLG